MKKLLTLALAALLTISLCACSFNYTETTTESHTDADGNTTSTTTTTTTTNGNETTVSTVTDADSDESAEAAATGDLAPEDESAETATADGLTPEDESAEVVTMGDLAADGESHEVVIKIINNTGMNMTGFYMTEVGAEYAGENAFSDDFVLASGETSDIFTLTYSKDNLLQADIGAAFEGEENIVWYTDCDFSGCYPDDFSLEFTVDDEGGYHLLF